MVALKGKSASSRSTILPTNNEETTPLLATAAPSEKTPTWKSEAKVLCRSSISLVIANLLQFSLNLSSMLVISARGKIELGAVSVAITTANITGFIVFQGLSTSLDTLCAQAWGSGNPQLVGLYVQRMIALLGVVGVPVAALWFNAVYLFSLILPDPETARLAGLYLRILVCGIPGFAMCEAGKRIFTAQGRFLPVTFILCAAACTNALLGWLLVWVFDFGFIGAPIAVVTTLTMLPIYLSLYLALGGGGEVRVRPTSKALTGWGPMLSLALPGLIMVEAEYLAFEILVIAAAQISTAHLAAQTILATLNGVFWQIPFSISIAGTTLIAQHIGAKSADMAKISAVVVFACTFLCSATNGTLFFSFRAFWPSIFTQDPDVFALVENTLPLVAVMQLFDGLAACCNGILRGIGRQSFGGWVNLSCYYIIALPLSLWTAFGLKWSLDGLWTGVTVALVIVTVAELIFLTKTDWQKCVEDAEWRNARPIDQEG